MKKKLLLIQPENPEINRFRRKQLNNFVQITMPYLAGFIDEAFYEITLIDEYNQKIPYQKPFDLVAITVNTPNARHCYRIAHAFRARGANIVMGGPHATLLPEEAALHCDYLLAGECEDTWPQFLRDFVAGCARRKYEPLQPPSLAHVPSPRWDLLRRRNSLMKGAVFATRGCPHHCRYCNLKQIYFDSFRARPVEDVLRDILSLRTKYFVFWDDNFFADRSYALLLMRAMKGLKKRWAAQVTLASCEDDELLTAAQECGCIYLFVGLESFSQASLADAGKPINRVADYKRIIGTIHRHRIMVQAGIIFGFDTDTQDIFRDTLRACEELGIDGATVSLLTPFPQTPVYDEMEAERRLRTGGWQYFNAKTHVAFRPKLMSAQKLYEGYCKFRRQFYSLRSFVRRMRVSKTRPFYNFLINLGYRLAIKGTCRISV